VAKLTDKEKLARLSVVADALRWMSASPGTASLARRDFFAPPKDNVSPEVLKVCRSKAWQQPVLDRLVEGTVLRRDDSDGQTKYRLDDVAVTRDILLDHKHKGVRLLAYLFPSEFSRQEISEKALELAEQDNATAATEMTEGDTQQSIEHVADLLVRLIDTLNRSNDMTYQKLNDISERMDRLVEATLALNTMVDRSRAGLGTIEKKLGGNNKRLEELTKRTSESCAKLDKQLSGPAQSALMANISEVVERAAHLHLADISAHVASISKEAKGVTKLQATADVIIAHLTHARRDRLTATLERLEAMAAETTALRDLLMEDLAKYTPEAKRGPE
jgi:hypothetical protein